MAKKGMKKRIMRKILSCLVVVLLVGGVGAGLVISANASSASEEDFSVSENSDFRLCKGFKREAMSDE